VFVDQFDGRAQLVLGSHDAGDDGLFCGREEWVVSETSRDCLPYGRLIRTRFGAAASRVGEPGRRKGESAGR
jgi:hypothetical protein